MVKTSLTSGLLFLLFVATGCGQNFLTEAQNAVNNPQSEPPYFGLSPVAILASEGYTILTVNTTAQFQRFNLTNTVSSSGFSYRAGYREDSLTTLPIPFAEFQVFDSTGARIQSGETLENGSISFQMLNKPGTYTLRVFSRSLNSNLKLSVLNNLSNRTPYSVESNFTISNQAGTLNLSNLIAPVTRTNHLGGAFNIHYAIYRAVKYLRTETSQFSSDSPAKVTAFWQLGFNPYSYFVANSQTGASFYTPDTNELFILGGLNGSYLDEDIDHFDDSVIIHEYGHFLEDEYSFSASPGGFHDADSIIDPRLAWSEGWANFLQGAIRSNQTLSGELVTARNRYIDVFGLETRNGGVVDTTSAAFLSFPLNENGLAAETDRLTDLYQGSHREFSIARTLFKGLTATSFSEYWNAFETVRDRSQAADGYRFFTSFQTFYTELSSTAKGQIATIVGSGDERQDIYLLEYNTPTTSSQPTTQVNIDACVRRLSPTRDNTTTGKSDQFYSNDFIRYVHDSSNTNLELKISGTTTTDLDLILYNEDYNYVEDSYSKSGQVIYPRKTTTYDSSVARASRGPASSEYINLSGLIHGKVYLLNIKAFTAGSAAAQTPTPTFAPVDYYLTLNSNQRILCPE